MNSQLLRQSSGMSKIQFGKLNARIFQIGTTTAFTYTSPYMHLSLQSSFHQETANKSACSGYQYLSLIHILKDASIFFQAENMLTLAKQQGLDPEQTFGGSTYYRLSLIHIYAKYQLEEVFHTDYRSCDLRNTVIMYKFNEKRK